MSDGIHSDTCGQTLEEMRKSYGKPNMQAFGLHDTMKAIATFTHSLQEPFVEITEEEFNWMLGLLPPARVIQDGYFVAEANYATLYPLYFTRDDKYYYGLRDIARSDAEILAEIDMFIGKY